MHNEQDLRDEAEDRRQLAEIPVEERGDDQWLSARVRRIIDEARKEDPQIDFGPGHILFADDNVDDGSLDFVVRECGISEKPREHVERVLRYVSMIRAIPEAERYLWVR